MTIRWLVMAVAAAAMTAAESARAAESDVRSRALPTEFELLKRKSIFAREHSLRRPERTVSTSTAPVSTVPRRPESPVLVGIVLDEAGPVAVLEMPETGQLSQLRVGESAPGAGPVVEITLDSISVSQSEGQPPRVIVIGQDLRGEAAALPARSTETAASTAGSATGTSTTTSATGPAGTNDVLERMRRRRQQELNR